MSVVNENKIQICISFEKKNIGQISVLVLLSKNQLQFYLKFIFSFILKIDWTL
jgi:hypothetical protein